MTDPIPVTLIGGYLGAGKTTLVNSLLRNAGGRRLAVLVNEFGSLPIDADLIVAREDNLISISGGCICCSFGSDLVAALIEIRARGEPLDHLLIETSGVALPESIVQSIALLPGLAIDGVIVLADAETVEERAGDRYMSDTVRGQLAGADIIVLNKVDLVSSERAGAIGLWLAGIAPGARVVPAEKADIPPEIILGGQPDQRSMAPRLQAPRHRTADYDTLSLELDSPVDAGKLGRTLADPRLGLLRTKGFLRGSDGAFVTLHVVGRRSQVEPAPSWIEGPGRLICIGFVAEMDRAAILAAIEACSGGAGRRRDEACAATGNPC
jgi:G3E family GTPase